MRLWHEDLIPLLPRAQLLGQHRECCALRGQGWGRKHSVVDYVFQYSPYKLYQYHCLIMDEMEERGYRPSPEWKDPTYRGKNTEPYLELQSLARSKPVYPEHNDQYQEACVANLRAKGIKLESYNLRKEESTWPTQK